MIPGDQRAPDRLPIMTGFAITLMVTVGFWSAVVAAFIMWTEREVGWHEFIM